MLHRRLPELALAALICCCAGPYRGPDAVPDELAVWWGEGTTEFGFQPFTDVSATGEEEQRGVMVTWYLQPPALPDETGARRNEVLAMTLEELRGAREEARLVHEQLEAIAEEQHESSHTPPPVDPPKSMFAQARENLDVIIVGGGLLIVFAPMMLWLYMQYKKAKKEQA